MKAILTTSLVLAISFLALSQWSRTTGPEGVSISSLANIDGTLYAGTETDGVYASTDDGMNWFPSNSGIETKSISSIAHLPGYIFAATFGNGVYRSTNGGSTWLAPTNGNNLFVVGLVAVDSFLFAGTGSDGVYRSTDYGKTWTQLFGVYGMLSMGICANKVFASTYGYTLVSTDYGENWNYVSDLEGAAPWSYYSKGDTILAGGVNEIYKSVNQGITFSTIPINFDFGIVNIYSITTIGSTIFLATSFDGVYKSTDYGSTWTAANEGMGPKDVRALTISDASTIIAGSHYVGIYRSTDMGSGWNKSMAGFPAGSTISTMLATENGIFAGTRDGVYRTTNNGANWTELAGTNDTINYALVRGLCEKDNVIYASTVYKFNATVYKSADNGLTWKRSGIGLPPDLTFINGLSTSGNNILAATDEGVYYSSNDGTTWNQANIPVEYIEDITASSGFAYAIVFGIGVYRSVDNGVNWSVVLPSTIDYVSMGASDNYVYAGSFFEGLRYSPSYGIGWYSSGGFPPETSVFGIGPVGDGMVLAGTDLEPNWIYVSMDYGGYFTPYSEGLGPWAIVEAFAVSDSFMFGGTDYNGVWRRLRPGIVPVELNSFTAKLFGNRVKLEWQTATETNNKGFEIERSQKAKIKSQKWEKIGFVKGKGSVTTPHSYSFIDKNVSSGIYNYRLKQIDFDGSFKYSKEIEVNINIPVEFSLEQNYPNPFNPTTTIGYSIPKDGMVNLSVFNVLGQKVEELLNKNINAGKHQITFNASELASGIYYYRLKSGDKVIIKKMIVLK